MTKFALLLQILWFSVSYGTEAGDGTVDSVPIPHTRQLRSGVEATPTSRVLQTDEDDLVDLLFGDEDDEEAEEVGDEDTDVDLHELLFGDDEDPAEENEDVDLLSILFDDDALTDDDEAVDDYYGPYIQGKGKGKSRRKGKGKGKGSSSKGKGKSSSAGKGKGYSSSGKGKGYSSSSGKGKGYSSEGKGKGKGATYESAGKGKGKGARTNGIYPRYTDIAFLDDEYFDDAFFEDDDCELIAFNETFTFPRAALFLAPDTTPTESGDPSLPGTMFIWENQEVFEGDGSTVVEGTRVSGTCTRTLGTTASTDGAASCMLVFTDTEGFSINVEGILEGPFGSTLGITGGTGGMVGIIGEMDFMPIYADGMGDILTDVTRYEVDGDLGIIVCP